MCASETHRQTSTFIIWRGHYGNKPLSELQGDLCQGLHTLTELSCGGSAGISQQVASIDALVNKHRTNNKQIEISPDTSGLFDLRSIAFSIKIPLPQWTSILRVHRSVANVAKGAAGMCADLWDTNLCYSCHLEDGQGQVEIHLWQSRWDAPAAAVDRDQVIHSWDTCSIMNGIDTKRCYKNHSSTNLVCILSSSPSIPFKLPIVLMMLRPAGQ